MVDTGFDGWLTLSPILIQLLRLPWFSEGSAELADGSQSFFDVYDAMILWDRTRRQVFVSEADSIPLVGMALMQGYNLKMQIQPRGKVTLTRMS